MNDRIEKNLITLPSLKGAIYVVAGKDDEENIGEVIISGDPDGLRSLGKVLIAMAELDQKAQVNLREDESEHIHLRVGQHIGEGDLVTHHLIISRLDMKNGKLKPFYRDTISENRDILESR